MHIKKIQPSQISLILSNLLVLFFAITYDWTLYEVLVLFWMETAIIGFYFLLRIPFVFKLASIFMLPFFMVHAGGFMLGHLFFIDALASQTISDTVTITDRLLLFLSKSWVAALFLFVSHGFSYFYNFIGKKEYTNPNFQKSGTIFAAFYKRIVLMHILLIVVIVPVMMIGGLLAAKILAIAIKIFFDLKSHNKEHGFISR